MIGAIHVSTAALRRNAEALRALAHPSQAAFVVKSNAYGHGLVETARAVEPLAACLGVYGATEALQLRVGRVAMNATLLDITTAPNARSGSRVTLIGTDGDASVSADDWAQWANTINYEIVARLPATLPRIYD